MKVFSLWFFSMADSVCNIIQVNTHILETYKNILEIIRTGTDNGLFHILCTWNQFLQDQSGYVFSHLI